MAKDVRCSRRTGDTRVSIDGQSSSLEHNPTWKNARTGEDRDKWKAADKQEREKQTVQQPGKDSPHLKELPGGLKDVSFGYLCLLL